MKIRDRVEALSGSSQDWARNSDRASINLQQHVQVCMKAAGFEYLPPTLSSVDFPGAVKQPFAWWGSVDETILSNHGFGLLEERLLSEGSPPPTAPNPGYDGLSPEGKTSYEAAASDCGDAEIEAASSERDANSIGYSLFHEIEDRVELALNTDDVLRKRYTSCMAESGFSVAAPLNIFNGVLQDKFDKLGAYQGSVESSTFLEALDFERLVALADARCRSALGHDLVELLNVEVQAWEEAHAWEAGTLKELWPP